MNVSLWLCSELGLLALKMAQAERRRTVVSVRQSQAHVCAHLKLLDLLQIRNNLITVSDLSLPLLAALSERPDPFQVSVIGASVVGYVFSSLLVRCPLCDWQ